MSEKKIPTRGEINKKDKWDLSYLFKNDDEWEVLYEKIESDIEKYNSFQGRMDESYKHFKDALDYDLDISRKLERLYTYAHLKSDEDKSDQFYLGLYQRAMSLYVKISELSSFLTPEIQNIPEDVMDNFFKEESIDEYRFYLEKILRYKPHTLSREIEEVLAMSGEISQASSEIFSQLDNVDLKFGTIEDEKGQKVELSHGNFNTFLINSKREIREKAFRQYYFEYDDHRYSMSTMLAHSNKKDFFYSKARKFKSCRDSSLFSDNISREVYDNLIRSVKGNLSPLFKYFRFRKDALGLDNLHFYDTYVPIISDINFFMPFEEAIETCIKSLQIMGDDYINTLEKGLKGGWVDKYENKGKRSGAYSSGCYDSPPYILMNYDEKNINSLYTLMHEAGHSMHSYYSKKSQPYIKHQYTIFVAEVASTFNETLLSKYLLDNYKDNDLMAAYILNREIDNIRGTLYRQTMFAEFEKVSHSLVEKGIPLTLDTLRDKYRGLLGEYFGDTIIIDDELSLEFLRIPHFYSAFYVYKYATGISAAISLAQKVLEEGEKARDAYLNFLSLGGSMYPLDQLTRAGVDMRKPGPVVNAVKYFDKLVDRFIDVYNNLKQCQ